MITIYKYVLTACSNTIQTHIVNKILFVDRDPASGHPAVWIQVDTDSPKDDFDFTIYGTGHFQGAHEKIYIGSAICGTFVWHVYHTLKK